MNIEYVLSSFPRLSGISNGKSTISLSWPELIHAAVTVGRKSRQDVIHHSYYSIQEINYRYFLIRAFLKSENNDLKISEAYKTLDPSEKGAVNYFIGSIFTKIIAERLFDTPWLMHLDVYKKNLYSSGTLHTASMDNTKSRPDVFCKKKVHKFAMKSTQACQPSI